MAKQSSNLPLRDLPQLRPEYDAECAAKVGITVGEWQGCDAKDQAALLAWSKQPVVRKSIDRSSAREAELPISAWLALPLGEARNQVLKDARQRKAIKFRKEHPEAKRTKPARPRKPRPKLSAEEAKERQRESKRKSAAAARKADPERIHANDKRYKDSHHDQIIESQRRRRQL